MKKWIAGIIAVLILLAISVPFIVPAPTRSAAGMYLKTPVDAANRALSSTQLWQMAGSSSFVVTGKFRNAVRVNLIHNKKTFPGSIIVYSLSSDSTAVRWITEMPPPQHILDRIRLHFMQRAARKKMVAALDILRSYCSDKKNLYGYPVRDHGRIKDSFLLSTRFTTPAYPSITDVYSKIGRLASVASSLGVKPSGFPMLNVDEQNGKFRTMVALPVERSIAETNSNDVSFINMLQVRYLVMDVTGGPETIRHAHKMLQLYILENRVTSMAIPFEYLITDRLAAKDTANWKTQIYWPVF